MGIMGTIGSAKAVIKEISSLEAKQDLLQLVNEALELSAKNRELEAEVRDLREKLKFAGTLKYRRNVYWSGDDPGPFCSGCWDGSRTAVRLSQFVNNPDRYDCPICDRTN